MLLVASHIKPWAASDPKAERLAPDNGLLLNALHDKAFDQGLITITKDLKIVVSSAVSHNAPENDCPWRYNGEPIAPPRRFSPRADFVEYHNDVVFIPQLRHTMRQVLRKVLPQLRVGNVHVCAQDSSSKKHVVDILDKPV